MHLATWEIIQVLQGRRTKVGQSSHEDFVEEEGLSRGGKRRLSTMGEQEMIQGD